MRRLKTIILALFCLGILIGPLAAQETLYLWPGKTAPGSKGLKAADGSPLKQELVERSRTPGVLDRAETGITQPYLTVYRSPTPNGTAVIIAPGGAYARVVLDKEGADIAAAYTPAGVTVFVLSYRLPVNPHQDASLAPLADAQRAIRLVRSKASDWGVNPDRVGVMGFSAGGHVAGSLGTRWEAAAYKPVDKADALSARPDFMLLIYPVITLAAPAGHAGSRTALLGSAPTEQAIAEHSLENLVTERTPPTFLALAANDTSVNPAGNGILFAQRLMEKRVPVELHVFPESGHGFGIRGALGTAKSWPELSLAWLAATVK